MEKILICKKDYFDQSGLTFDRGVPYRVVGEHETTSGKVLEILGLDGQTSLMGEEAAKEFFFEDAPGSLYAIRRFANELPLGEYGIDNQFYLVGAFTSRKVAIKTWETLCEEANAGHDEDVRYELFVFVPNRIYARGKQPWLGGGSCIE